MASNRIDLSDALWFKSSYSNGDGGECVEVASDFPGAALWRKSSYSNASGGNCVEIATDFPGAALWRKSTYCSEAEDACLEVADNIPGLVPVRDSKSPQGPVLVLPATAWTPFVAFLK